MRIEKITKEMKFKNYTALCKTLDIKVAKGGRNLKLQKEELKRFFDWQVEGREITITEIYDEQKEKVDGRGKSEGSRENNVKYQDDMTAVIEHYLASCNKFKLDITIGNLALNSNIVSKAYIDCKKDEDDYFEALDYITNRSALGNTMYSMYHVLNDGIHGALKKLQKQEKISYKDVNFIQMHGELSIITKEMQKELDKIENIITREFLYEYNKKSKNEITSSPKLRIIYYKRVFEEFKKKYNDVSMLFKGVQIFIIDCNVHEDIIEVNNNLIETLRFNILEKNRKKVVNVKAQYKSRVDEKKVGFGNCLPPMAHYEVDIIQNEKYYIEDTISLMKMFCGQSKKYDNEKIENIVQAKIIDFDNINKFTKDNEIKVNNIPVSNNETPMAL